MTHRLVTPADGRSMPWKNGGGATVEIATGPAGAGLDAFTWRASIATIARDGPFSAFPGIDRTLVLLSGSGMRLAIAGEPVVLDAPCAAVSFAGEADVTCALTDGVTRDFNFMVRRSQASAHVVVVRGEPHAVAPAWAIVCHAAAGQWTCADGRALSVPVAEGDTLVVEGDDARGGLDLTPGAARAVMLVAAVHRATPT